MNNERLQKIKLKNCDPHSLKFKTDTEWKLASMIDELVAAVEELQAENERLEELEEPLVRWCNGYVDEISRLKAEIDMLTKGAQ